MNVQLPGPIFSFGKLSVMPLPTLSGFSQAKALGPVQSGHDPPCPNEVISTRSSLKSRRSGSDSPKSIVVRRRSYLHSTSGTHRSAGWLCSFVWGHRASTAKSVTTLVAQPQTLTSSTQNALLHRPPSPHGSCSRPVRPEIRDIQSSAGAPAFM